jgi:hypothetical protein
MVHLHSLRRKDAHSSWLLLSRLDWLRRVWFVHNTGLTIFHRNKASLRSRAYTSLDTYGTALARVVMKHFSYRNIIIHPHLKIVDSTLFFLQENLIIHHARPFLSSFSDTRATVIPL